MSFDVWLTFVAASTALLLIPGPTVLLVLSYAVSQGRRVALATALGVALGDLIAMTASLAGLGALILTSAQLFTIIKWIGAAYLVWLGWQLLRSAGRDAQSVSMNRTASVSRGLSSSIFWHSAAVTALNPKSIVFFIAFVPQFVSASQPLLPQFIILVVTFVGLAALNALAYALLGDGLGRRLTGPAAMTWLQRAGGGALIAMGLSTAFLVRRAQ
ncbi:MAG: LysE family translocator [Ahrensia sp.]|nr:LysE family translocator [Ahrensia sp.]